MQLTLSQSTLRSFRPGDEASITRHAGSYRVARNLSAMPHPYSLQHAESWIAKASGAQPETNFAITVDDQVVGGIGLTVGDAERLAVCEHDAEVGYWLGEAFWGRGLMTEVVIAFTEWAFSELKLSRLHAAVYARNPASARVLAKAGYEYEGRQRARYFREGKYIDALLYAKVRLPA